MKKSDTTPVVITSKNIFSILDELIIDAQEKAKNYKPYIPCMSPEVKKIVETNLKKLS